MAEHGAADLVRAAEDLGARLPEPLAPLARLAYNYWWSWAPGGRDLFRSVDPERFALVRENPVRLLLETSTAALRRAAEDGDLLEQAEELESGLREELERPPADGELDADRPVAFLCAEYGIHPSLPVYSGGLGVLAGDILKEASDRALPLVGVGIMYSQGMYHQRLDLGGWQHDYWFPSDPPRLPAALVTGDDGTPLTVTIPVRGRDVLLQVWRVDVGRVPLYLLDANRPQNTPMDRWITSRLYVGDRKARLAQYAVLGVGGIRALRAMGIDPGVVHLNEGHPALAPIELAVERMAEGASFRDALEEARSRTVFTTHTPVPAGNETYSQEETLEALGGYADAAGIGGQALLAVGLAEPEGLAGEFGMSTLALRVSRAANAVSRRHGEVARSMWRPLFGEIPNEEVPIAYVTNGVHVPTWMAPEMADLLARYLGTAWREAPADPDAWAGVDAIPDEELWGLRCRLRARLVAWLRERSVLDRLARGEPSEYVARAMEGFDPGALTLGFAKRVATYKRLYLLVMDPDRALRLLQGPQAPQLVLSGKAHPDDEEAKASLAGLFRFKGAPEVGSRVAYVEDYDMAVATQLVWGCDVWVNLPRPPLEASGTSGMKSALNGGLNLSVLDGWWAEAHDGTNGWATPGELEPDPAAQDARDAEAFYELLEREVIPLFHERDETRIPRGWVARVKASIRTIGPRFSATRMMDEYRSSVYASLVPR